MLAYVRAHVLGYVRLVGPLANCASYNGAPGAVYNIVGISGSLRFVTAYIVLITSKTLFKFTHICFYKPYATVQLKK